MEAMGCTNKLIKTRQTRGKHVGSGEGPIDYTRPLRRAEQANDRPTKTNHRGGSFSGRTTRALVVRKKFGTLILSRVLPLEPEKTDDDGGLAAHLPSFLLPPICVSVIRNMRCNAHSRMDMAGSMSRSSATRQYCHHGQITPAPHMLPLVSLHY